ncbi:MAG: tRNA pseudouridine(55) synthase TruB [Micrococcaceae bacterium]
MKADGILLIDKTAGLSSHAVVAKARHLLRTRKIGHAGTLDPMATGLLILGINRGTKFLNYLITSSKSYDATIRLGQSTITDDAEGEVISTKNTSAITDEQITQEVIKLTGNIMQVPAKVSAIKINGQRSYAKVRAGENVELKARPVTIYDFQVANINRVEDFIDVDVRVTCSSGTYIRALARDIGNALDVGGHLTKLRRTSIEKFSVTDAVSIETLNKDTALLPLASVAAELFPSRQLDAKQVLDVMHGRFISADNHQEIYAAYYKKELIALLKNKGKHARLELLVKIS